MSKHAEYTGLTPEQVSAAVEAGGPLPVEAGEEGEGEWSFGGPLGDDCICLECGAPVESAEFDLCEACAEQSTLPRVGDDDWKREQAMQEGMMHGVEAYNDAMGWSTEESDE